MDISLVIDLIITTIVAGRQSEITVQTYKHKDDFNRHSIVNVCNALNALLNVRIYANRTTGK